MDTTLWRNDKLWKFSDIYMANNTSLTTILFDFIRETLCNPLTPLKIFGGFGKLLADSDKFITRCGGKGTLAWRDAAVLRSSRLVWDAVLIHVLLLGDWWLVTMVTRGFFADEVITDTLLARVTDQLVDLPRYLDSIGLTGVYIEYLCLKSNTFGCKVMLVAWWIFFTFWQFWVSVTNI